jgi:hypothetical protein
MECTLALLADAANVSQEGKLNILGAFTNIYSKIEPIRHRLMVLVLVFEASPAEVNQTKHLEIKTMGEDGEAAWGMTGEFVVPPALEPGSRIFMQSILTITDVVFPKAGAYKIAVMANGQPLREIPLSVALRGDDDGN